MPFLIDFLCYFFCEFLQFSLFVCHQKCQLRIFFLRLRPPLINPDQNCISLLNVPLWPLNKSGVKLQRNFTPLLLFTCFLSACTLFVLSYIYIYFFFALFSFLFSFSFPFSFFYCIFTLVISFFCFIFFFLYLHFFLFFFSFYFTLFFIFFFF